MKSKTTGFLFIFLVLMLGSQSAFSETVDMLWQVGIARADITPTDSLWLAGYAARDHGAVGTLHKIWAKALALQDAKGNRGVLVTADLLGFPKQISDAIRKKCQEKFGLERRQIILSCSHTHTGPVLQGSLSDIYFYSNQQQKMIDKYSDCLENDVVNLVGRALEKMTPARLSAGNGVVRFQINRRNNPANTLTSQTDLNGPNDYAVPVLAISQTDSNLLAVTFGYACHPTVLNSYQWSGDYPGFAQLELEKRFPGATALFFQGCGADQNPLPRRSVSLARQYGEELASAVSRVLEDGRSSLSSELKMACTEVPLLLNKPPDEETLQKIVSEEKGYRKKWAQRMLDKLQQGEPFKCSYPYTLQVWKIGNQALFVLGGEVVIDYAIRLKRIFGENIFVMAYANDVMAYIPSARILREGGYEGTESQIVYGLPATWRADTENKILNAAIDLAVSIGVPIPETPLIREE